MTYLLSSLAVKFLMLIASIGFVGLLVSFRILLDMRDIPRNEPNVGDE